MALSDAQIQWIARLARLQVDPEERPGYTEQLSRILNFVEQMNALDTDNVEPLAHPLDLAARWRDDAVSEAPDRDAYQAQAPAVQDGFYLVPKVIE